MRVTGDAAALAVFRANGLTRAADEACLKQEVQAHKVWTRTRSVLALNPYQDLATAPATDVDFTVKMAKQCRTVLGNRCVLENHSIREASLGADYERLFTKMTALGRPLAMQTNRPEVLGDLGVVLRRCVAMGAEAVELAVDVPPAGAGRLPRLLRRRRRRTRSGHPARALIAGAAPAQGTSCTEMSRRPLRAPRISASGARAPGDISVRQVPPTGVMRRRDPPSAEGRRRAWSGSTSRRWSGQAPTGRRPSSPGTTR